MQSCQCLANFYWQNTRAYRAFFCRRFRRRWVLTAKRTTIWGSTPVSRAACRINRIWVRLKFSSVHGRISRGPCMMLRHASIAGPWAFYPTLSRASLPRSSSAPSAKSASFRIATMGSRQKLKRSPRPGSRLVRRIVTKSLPGLSFFHHSPAMQKRCRFAP
jgi:hypothetical protein